MRSVLSVAGFGDSRLMLGKGGTFRQGQLLLLAIAAGMMVSSTALAQSSSIALASDRETTGFDLWTIEDDGDNPTQVSFEAGNALRPSYSDDGQLLFFDLDGDIWVMNTSGSPSPQNLTDSLSSPDPCIGNEVCEDADAGPKINTDGDYLITFTREVTQDTTGHIVVATFDQSAGVLTNFHQLTSDNLINYHPAWCGDDHIVWSREIPPTCLPCGLDVLYYWELCVQQVNQSGVGIGSPTCYLGGTHEKANQHPSCNSNGTKVAFAQSDGDLKQGTVYVEQPHEICTMRLNSDPESTLDCLDNAGDPQNLLDDTNPVWSPGNSQIAFASERALNGPTDTDYEIWVVNSNFSGTPVPLTDDEEQISDNYPDWGPANLP